MSNFSTNGAVNEILDKLPANPFDPATIENSLNNIDTNTASTYSQEVVNGSKLDTVNAHLQNIETTQGGQYSEDILSRVALQNIDTGIDNIEVYTAGTNGATVSIDSKITACNTGAVVVSSSVLPTGAATATLQTTGNTALSTIVTNTTGVSTAANQTSTNTKLDTIITNTNNLLLGTTGAITSLTPVAALSSGNQTLITANSARRGLTIYNNTNHPVFLAIGSTANTTTSFSLVIPVNSLYEVPNKFVTLLFSFSITSSSSTGNILVTSLT